MPHRKIHVTYLGGPTVILEVGNLRIMTDPTLDPAGTSYMINNNPAYSKTEGPVITDVGKIDMVLLSHDQHDDNLDYAGRELLATVPQTFTTATGAERLKGNARGLQPWESVTVTTPTGELITITATPARHGPAGIERIAGDVVGFLLTYGGRQFYLTGDTVFYDGVRSVAEKSDPAYVFIFAGAAKPRGPFSLTMSTNDALDTAFAFPEAKIIPVHFEGWTHYTETGDMLRQSFTTLGIAERLQMLEPGERTAL